MQILHQFPENDADFASFWLFFRSCLKTWPAIEKSFYLHNIISNTKQHIMYRTNQFFLLILKFDKMMQNLHHFSDFDADFASFYQILKSLVKLAEVIFSVQNFKNHL